MKLREWREEGGVLRAYMPNQFHFVSWLVLRVRSKRKKFPLTDRSMGVRKSSSSWERLVRLLMLMAQNIRQMLPVWVRTGK